MSDADDLIALIDERIRLSLQDPRMLLDNARGTIVSVTREQRVASALIGGATLPTSGLVWGTGLGREPVAGDEVIVQRRGDGMQFLLDILDDIPGSSPSVPGVAGSLAGVYNVLDYGAVGGDASRDALGIQAAVLAAEDAGGGVVWLPAGAYLLNEGIRVRRPGVRIVGTGRDTWHTVQPTLYDHYVGVGRTTSLVWVGASGGTMLTLRPDAAQPELGGNDVMHLNLIGSLWPHVSNVAAIGLAMYAVGASTINVMTVECSEAGVLVTGEEGGACTTFCHFEYIGGRQITQTGAILKMNGSATRGDGFNNTFDIVEGVNNNGIGVDVGHADSNTFELVKINSAGGTGRGLMFRASSYTNGPARSNQMRLVYPGFGGVEAEGTAAATYPSGWSGTGHPNIIDRLDTFEDGAPDAPVLGAGAELIWFNDELATGRGWAPYAHTLDSDPTQAGATTLTLAAVAAGLGGAVAWPIDVRGHMFLWRLAFRQNSVASLRTAEWGLYVDHKGTNELVRLLPGAAISFTPGAASTVLSVIGGPLQPFRLAPGIYWVVLRNTSAAQTFEVGSSLSGLGRSCTRIQTGAAVAALGATINISGWGGSTAFVSSRLDGEIGAEGGAFG